MQIAKVVPNLKTRNEGIFDYAIPPELLPQIQLGVLVEVPFHGRNVEGIIIDLKRSSKISNLKSLISIVDPQPVIGETKIELSRWMAEYYLTSLGRTMFENIVAVAKRKVSKDTINQNSFQLAKTKECKKILINAGFPERLKFYHKAIEKTISSNKQIIILVPDLSLIKYFLKNMPEPISFIHAGLTKTQRWLEWDRIRDNKVKIIIGSQSALFAPANNLGLVIIDQEESETYKNDRSPRIHFVDVAEKLCELTGANLILGSLTPRLETFQKVIENKFLYQETQKNTFQNTVVNMVLEKKAISQTLEEKISDILDNQGKIVLVLNRKGDGAILKCADCNTVIKCPRCNLPLVPQKNNSACFRCEKTYPQVEKCPKCFNFNLKLAGLSTGRIAGNLKKLFPEAKIIRIENFDPQKKSEDTATLQKGSWDISIVTSFALKFNFPKVDLVAVIDADQNLNLPDFRAQEKSFSVFYKFLSIAKKGMIQTHFPESNFIKYLGQMDYKNFVLNELDERKTNTLPPFSKLIRLVYKDKDENKCIKEAQRIYDQLLAFDFQLSALFGPSPAFLAKKRDSYRYQILIKSEKLIPFEIKNILKILPKGWTVDVDPIDLL